MQIKFAFLQAVLEGKWPTNINQGRLLWRKLRNVVIGVAKFKKAVRRRSMSVYSNSGSEYDQTSVDSCLEDEKTDTKHESIMKGDNHIETGTYDSVPGAKHGKIPEEVEGKIHVLDSEACSAARFTAQHFHNPSFLWCNKLFILFILMPVSHDYIL